MIMKTELFDTEILSSLDKLGLKQSKFVALGLVNQMPRKSIRQATSVNRIVHDVTVAKTAIEVSRIMYQVYLSGIGLNTVNSSWKKHYANV
jgi:hypothetical protein